MCAGYERWYRSAVSSACTTAQTHRRRILRVEIRVAAAHTRYPPSLLAAELKSDSPVSPVKGIRFFPLRTH